MAPLSSPSIKTTAAALALLGFYGTWLRSLLNGSLAILFRALHVTGTLPGSNTAIKTRFTGIYWPVDYLLDVLVVFFWQAVDGSHPQTSAFGLYFAGQHIAVITALYVENYKSGRNWKWSRSATLWLLLFQLTGIAVTGPLFLLLSSAIPSTSSDLFRLELPCLNSIRLLPFSILGGYITLVIFMALPSSGPRALVSSEAQQVAVVCWNLFPLFVASSQYALEKVLSVLLKRAGKKDSSGGVSNSRESVIRALRRTYAVSLFLCIGSHVALITMTLTAFLFPMLFDAAVVQSLTPGQILQIPLSHDTVQSMGVGTLQFMQWDALVGCLSMLVLAATSYIKTRGTLEAESSMVVLVLKVLVAVFTLGPGSTFLILRWWEDEMLVARSVGKREVVDKNTAKSGSRG